MRRVDGSWIATPPTTPIIQPVHHGDQVKNVLQSTASASGDNNNLSIPTEINTASSVLSPVAPTTNLARFWNCDETSTDAHWVGRCLSLPQFMEFIEQRAT